MILLWLRPYNCGNLERFINNVIDRLSIKYKQCSQIISCTFEDAFGFHMSLLPYKAKQRNKCFMLLRVLRCEPVFVFSCSICLWRVPEPPKASFGKAVCYFKVVVKIILLGWWWLCHMANSHARLTNNPSMFIVAKLLVYSDSEKNSYTFPKVTYVSLSTFLREESNRGVNSKLVWRRMVMRVKYRIQFYTLLMYQKVRDYRRVKNRTQWGQE